MIEDSMKAAWRSLRESEKLVRKFQATGTGKELAAVLGAAGTVIEEVIELIPDKQMRSHLMLRLMHLLFSSAGLSHVNPEKSQQHGFCPSTISDTDLLNATALARIKAILEATPPLVSDTNQEFQSVLQRPYKPIRSYKTEVRF